MYYKKILKNTYINTMKLLFALLLPAFLNAQWHPIPEKKDNAVRISNVTFQQATRKLIDNSYRIEKIDSNYKTIQVNLDEHTTMNIRFDSSGNMIIRGDFYIAGNMFAQHSPVMYYNAKMNRALWDMMMKYCDLFEGREYGKL